MACSVRFVRTKEQKKNHRLTSYSQLFFLYNAYNSGIKRSPKITRITMTSNPSTVPPLVPAQLPETVTQGPTLDLFGKMLLYWRNGRQIQDTYYPRDQFPSIVSPFPTTQVSIVPSPMPPPTQIGGTPNYSNSTASFSTPSLSFASPSPTTTPQPASHHAADMDVDVPDLSPIERLDDSLDLDKLAASFSISTVQAYFGFPHLAHFPMLSLILYDAQNIAIALMTLVHGAWQKEEHPGLPSEADIALIAFNTSYIMHHRLVAAGTPGLYPAELCEL